MDKNIINICFCTDENFIKFMPTVINSIYHHNKHSLFYFHIIHNIIDTQILNNYALFIKNKFNYDLTFYFCNENPEYKKTAHISIATMFRLYICDLLKDINRVIYLDLDIIVCADLSKLNNVEINETGIAAFSSSTIPGKSNSTSKMADGKVKFTKAFNAGVIVMDLKQLRANDFSKKVKEIMGKYPYNDQVILNIYCNSKYTDIHPRYNILNTFGKAYDIKSLLRTKDFILHYVSSQKPWNSQCPNKKIFFKYYITLPTQVT